MELTRINTKICEPSFFVYGRPVECQMKLTSRLGHVRTKELFHEFNECFFPEADTEGMQNFRRRVTMAYVVIMIIILS